MGHERAAAQAAPGRSARGGGHQPVPQIRFVRRVGDMPLTGTAEQAPVHNRSFPSFPAHPERRHGAQIHGCITAAPRCSVPVGEGDGQAEMTDHKIPSRGQTATFSVNGVKRGDGMLLLYPDELTVVNTRDRKSTRLNSSHMSISYAVFCLKKKKK